MSCSKPLPPFVCDSLYYLNRNQLERFSIVCRQLKNFIERYLHTKPYRVFDCLDIRGGSYALIHNKVHWHPNRNNYSAQQFLAGNSLHDSTVRNNHGYYYPFAEMRRFLGRSVRIQKTCIHLDVGITYNPEHMEQMESITYLWCNQEMRIRKTENYNRIVSEDFQLVLNSPTILKCQYLFMIRAHFSFKDYKILYSAKMIENYYGDDATDPDYWPEFLNTSNPERTKWLIL